MIIIIMSCREHGFPWLSLAIRLYRPSHSAGPLEYILCLYRAVEESFLADVQYLLVRMKVSTGERRLWARSYFSRSVLHALFVWFE